MKKPDKDIPKVLRILTPYEDVLTPKEACALRLARTRTYDFISDEHWATLAQALARLGVK